MLSSMLRVRTGLQSGLPRSLSSQFTDQTSPAVARRSATEDRRRLLADYNSHAEEDGEDFEDEDGEDEDGGEDEEEEEDEEEDEGEGEESGNDDEDGLTPLLPIFEAAHLGLSFSFCHKY